MKEDIEYILGMVEEWNSVKLKELSGVIEELSEQKEQEEFDLVVS